MFKLAKYQKIINIFFFLIIFFCVINFNFTSNANQVVAQILFAVYLILIVGILRSNIFKYVYEPPVFFLFFSFIYEFFKFPYYFGYAPVGVLMKMGGIAKSISPVTDYYIYSAEILIYQIVCIIILVFAYLVARRLNDSELNMNREFFVKKENILVYFSIGCVLFSFVSVLALTGGNIFLLLTRRAGNSEAGEILSDNYLVSLLSALVLLIIPIVIALKIFTGKKWAKLIYIYVPAIFLYYVITGTRGVALYSILILLIVLSFRFKITLVQIVVVGAALLLSFSLLGLVRRAFSNTDDIVENIKARSETESIEWYYELSSYQMQLRDETAFSNASIGGYLLGESYMNLIFFPIPRSIAGDLKPRFIDKIVGMELYNRDDVGLPLNAMGESYYNFSVFGVFVFVIMGFIMAAITNFLNSKNSILYTCTAIVLLFYSQTWSTSFLVYSLQYFLIMLIPMSFIKFGYVNSKK